MFLWFLIPRNIYEYCKHYRLSCLGRVLTIRKKNKATYFFQEKKSFHQQMFQKMKKSTPIPRPSRFYLGLMLSDRPDVMQTSLCLFLENAVNNQILFI